MHELSEWLNYLGISMTAMVGTFGIPVLAALAIITINRTLRRLVPGLQPRLHIHPSAVNVVTRTIGGVLWIVAALLIFNSWGVSVSGLWTVMLSVLTAVGVGFLAVWTMVSNVTASLFITIWRPFHFGETVEILPEGMRGRVIDRNLMFTAMRESNGTILYVPNNFFFQKVFRTGEEVETATPALAAKAVHPPAEMASP